MKQLTTILMFGAIWGLLEATLGGALHLIRLPFTGTIMASIGFALLYGALRAGARPSQLFAVALVAAAFKFADGPIFGLPFLDRTIVNPAVAIASQGLACAVVLRPGSVSERSWALGLRFLGAAAISVVAFNAVSLGAFGWETNQSKDMAVTALIHLPIIALASTVLARSVVERLGVETGLRLQTAAAAAACTLALVARFLIR